MASPTDRFGFLALDPIPVPIRESTKGDVIGDILLPPGDALIYYIGEFLKTLINSSCGKAWEMLGGKLPVVELAYVDPEDRSFNARDLPALYIYRDTFPATRIGDDMYVQKSNVAAYWIPSPAVLQRRQERAPFANAIAAVINRAIIRGRDPSWIVPGDTDPDAPLFGSSLLKWAGADRSMTVSESKRSVVTIEGHEGSYTGLKVIIQTEELYHEDLALRYTPTHLDQQIQQQQAGGDGTTAYVVNIGEFPISGVPLP